MTLCTMKVKMVLLLAICFFLFKTVIYCQTATEVLYASLDSLDGINTVSFKVSYYSYLNGSAEADLKGTVVIEKSSDSILGMRFILSIDSIENIFDGNNAFEINHYKKTVRQINPQSFNTSVFKAFLVKELIYGYEREALTGSTINPGETSNHYIIAYSASTKNDTLIKKIFINRHTGYPERFESTKHYNGTIEEMQILLSELVINVKSIPRVDTRIVKYLDKYTLLPVEDIGSPLTLNARDSLLGMKAPDFSLTSFSERSVSLSDFKGKLVLLDFWEVWCGPCRMSMSHLQEIHDKFSEKGLVILGITRDNIIAARGLLASKKVTYENLAGSDKVYGDYKVQEIPQYFLVDESGIIVYITKTGFEKRLEDMIIQRIR